MCVCVGVHVHVCVCRYACMCVCVGVHVHVCVNSHLLMTSPVRQTQQVGLCEPRGDQLSSATGDTPENTDYRRERYQV